MAVQNVKDNLLCDTSFLPFSDSPSPFLRKTIPESENLLLDYLPDISYHDAVSCNSCSVSLLLGIIDSHTFRLHK